jgi:hypothetical protein
MRKRAGEYHVPLVERAARIAFAFVVMNYSAIAGLGVVLMRKDVWRQS